ncbi:shikimate dehydrogenase [Citricoccus muralis]|uniref:Shikimate dehydrogenase n=1 Tax=Citricoccus muralis TaxID=169134 RepID=A0ABY8H7K2_9MICC|nr:shikimate dehydrogenase [Citricoccus muralis]WFP16901.1 shikimate dehydrogenase [Citricoccus muralis]
MSTVSESYLVGLIGDGITASLSPPMHEKEGREHGLLYLYRPVDLTALELSPEHASRLLKTGVELGFNAFNITHPVKQLIMEHLDEIDDDARALGAVNTVLIRDGKTIGYNTDFSGYTTGLEHNLDNPDYGNVVQLGTGGAGAAVAYALLRAGAEKLTLIDLDADRARERAEALQQLFPQQQVVAVEHGNLETALKDATGFAQCTPVGMNIHPGLPVDPTWLPENSWVSDVIYLPRNTELIEAARARGLQVADGGGMAVGQAVDAFKLITGILPDQARMNEHFQRLSAGQQG